MKILFVFICLLLTGSMKAQVTEVTLQASGLTCSMCSNAINKALLTLPVVKSVEPDIKSSSFKISLKPDVAFSFDEMKKKVEGAGFFVARFQFTMNTGSIELSPDLHLRVNDMQLHFLNVKQETIKGEHSFQVVDKGYLSAKAFKKQMSSNAHACTQTGLAASCCSSAGFAEGSRVYHVIL
jgi:copper chaperone CopZ